MLQAPAAPRRLPCRRRIAVTAGADPDGPLGHRTKIILGRSCDPPVWPQHGALHMVVPCLFADEDKLPTHWSNIIPFLDVPPPPPLNPGTLQPLGPEDLAPLFPMALIEQEVTMEKFIAIPEEVREVYKLWR